MAMTMEELQAEILRINKQNEDLSNLVKEKDELIEGFKAKNLEHTEAVSKYQEQIMRLRDMNTDLFLRVSQPVEPVAMPSNEPEGPSPEETITLNDILG